MKMPWESTIEGIIGLASEFITDKDKLAELQYKAKELDTAIRSELLKTKTIPWVDALIKFMVALRDVVIPLLRPTIAAGMTAFAAYMRYKQIPMDPTAEIVFASAAPAWGVSRHKNKQEEQKTKQVQAEWGWDDIEDLS